MQKSGSVFLIFLLCVACSKNSGKKEFVQQKAVQVPAFNKDSAYAFIARQVDFGPRIPNTEAHRKTGNFLVAKLKSYGAQVIEQTFIIESFDGNPLKLRNIIASYKPEKVKRLLLAAHWDTRPFADKDKENPNSLFDGANDGASGVGVLIEIARTLAGNAPENVGVDLIFFDGEDWGELESTQDRVQLPKNLGSWWCLGSQYWSKNKHQNNYSAYYGILLDMVGGKDAKFYKEGISLQYAPAIVEKVWSKAANLGYSHIFVNGTQGSVTDDHYFVNSIAKIPMIDIISYSPQEQNFGDFHHTRKDNMEIISKATLQAVGTTLLHVIYTED